MPIPLDLSNGPFEKKFFLSPALIGLIAILFITLPIISFFVTQRQQIADIRNKAASGQSICGGSCATDSDCKPSSGGNYKTICNTNHICANPNCPLHTIPGTICACNTPTQSCGQICGDQGLGKGLFPLCGDVYLGAALQCKAHPVVVSSVRFVCPRIREVGTR